MGFTILAVSVHAGEHDHVGLGDLRGHQRQLQRIADEVRHLEDFRTIVIVRDDDGVALFLQMANLLVQSLELTDLIGRVFVGRHAAQLFE